MNIFIASLLSLFLSSNLFASTIDGLNQAQIKDLDICLKKKNLTFAQINKPQMTADLLTKPIIHNFNRVINEQINYTYYSESIIISGLFEINGKHSFKNSIIANVTFIGDYSHLYFEGACLVNVHFQQGSFGEMIRIKYMSNFTKNISSH